MDERHLAEAKLEGLTAPRYSLEQRTAIKPFYHKGIPGVWTLKDGVFCCLKCSFACYVISITTGILVKSAHFSVMCRHNNHRKHMMPKTPLWVQHKMFRYRFKINFVAECVLNEESCRDFLSKRSLLLRSTQQAWDLLPIEGSIGFSLLKLIGVKFKREVSNIEMRDAMQDLITAVEKNKVKEAKCSFKIYMRQKTSVLRKLWTEEHQVWAAEVLTLNDYIFRLDSGAKTDDFYLSEITENPYFSGKMVRITSVYQDSLFDSDSENCSLEAALESIKSRPRSEIANVSAPVNESNMLPRFMADFIAIAQRLFDSSLYELKTIRFLVRTANFAIRPHIETHSETHITLFQQLVGKSVFFVFPPPFLGMLRLIETGKDFQALLKLLKLQRINSREFVLSAGEVVLLMPGSVYAVWTPELEDDELCCARSLEIRVKHLDDKIALEIDKFTKEFIDLDTFKVRELDPTKKLPKRKHPVSEEAIKDSKKKLRKIGSLHSDEDYIERSPRHNGSLTSKTSPQVEIQSTSNRTEVLASDPVDDINIDDTSDGNEFSIKAPLSFVEKGSSSVNIRAITAFIQLKEDFSVDDVEDEFLAAVEFLIEAKKSAEKEFGIGCLRICTNSGDEWLPPDERKRDMLLNRISGMCKGRVDFFNIGPVNGEIISSALEMCSTLQCSFKLNANDFDSALNAANILKQELRGNGSSRLFYSSSFVPNNVDDNVSTTRWFSFELENGEFLNQTIQNLGRNFNFEEFQNRFVQHYEEILLSVEETCLEIEEKNEDFKFSGIDSTLSASLESSGTQSMASNLTKLLGTLRNRKEVCFGDNGSIHICSSLAKSVLKASKAVKTYGSPGITLPLHGNQGLLKTANSFSRQDIMSFMAVPGVGIERFPVPENISHEDLASIIMDVAAISTNWSQPVGFCMATGSGRETGTRRRA